MRSILIVAFDGLQPSQVTPRLMPNLASFTAEGVTFANHHAVFPTVTRTNAASMATGCYPGRHGLAANTVVFRDFDPDRVFSALEPTLSQVTASLGSVLLVPTIADTLAGRDEEYVAVVSGSSGNAYVHNPNAERAGGATIHPDFCLPRPLHDEIVTRFGPWPEEVKPNTGRMARAVDILTQYVIEERGAAVSLLWLSEPDQTQHAHAAGSPQAAAALLEADSQFGRLLEWLDETGRAAHTDILVVSDHGHSAVLDTVDIQPRVAEAVGESRIIAAENGGAVLFYVHRQDRAVADRLAAYLMAQPWCGPILASERVGPIEGALSAGLAGSDGARAPDLIASFAWTPAPGPGGVPGLSYCTGADWGQGVHGSMSRQEIHNVLIARGPSFRRRAVLTAPSGNVDLAPTVLEVLGITPAGTIEGRPLREALASTPGPADVDWTTETHAAERRVEGGTYRQRITVSRVGQTSYVDEGSAELRL